MTQISSDMNIIEEAVKDPKELTSLLEDVINAREVFCKYFGIKIISIIAGKKGFSSDRIAALLPLIRLIE